MASHLDINKSDLQLIEGKGHEVVKKIGEGSYAKVYLVKYRPSLNKSIEEIRSACKIIDLSKMPKKDLIKFLTREMSIISELKHPFVVTTYQILTKDMKYYIFMRLGENGDLLEYINKKGKVPELQARLWSYQLASALNYLHTQGIVHRDFKVENIVLSASWNVIVCDFGFARRCIKSNGSFCACDTGCGSLSYTAPEVIRGISYDGRLSDSWSLGVVIFTMVCQCLPFPQPIVRRLVEAQEKKSYHFPSKVKLSNSLKKAIGSLLEPNAKKRWTVSNFLSCAWLAEEPSLLRMSEVEQSALAEAEEYLNKVKAGIIDVREKSLPKIAGNNPLIELKAEDTHLHSSSVHPITESTLLKPGRDGSINKGETSTEGKMAVNVQEAAVNVQTAAPATSVNVQATAPAYALNVQVAAQAPTVVNEIKKRKLRGLRRNTSTQKNK